VEIDFNIFYKKVFKLRVFLDKEKRSYIRQNIKWALQNWCSVGKNKNGKINREFYGL
jgi:hypothetical protein